MTGEKMKKQQQQQINKDQKQQRLERTREHHQKLQLCKKYNDNKLISFGTHSKCQLAQCSNQKT